MKLGGSIDLYKLQIAIGFKNSMCVLGHILLIAMQVSEEYYEYKSY
jgi:hypothetical protein